MKPAQTREEATRVGAALRDLGFTRASLAVASDRANRYFFVPGEELRRVGESDARAAIEPIFPGAKAEFFRENPTVASVPIDVPNGGSERF